MNHADHVALIREGIPQVGGVWADFGSGTGAFTLALADCLGPDGQIYSIDKSERALREQQREMNGRFPQTRITYLIADYTRPLDLPPLDGILIANALHFQRRKEGIVRQLYDYLRPGGRLIMVEYNLDRGNMWVPHPFSYPTWETIASRSGFVQTQKLNVRPSRFLREIYSAVCQKPA
ncbi:MAG: class I SAM-dependent methyltransferase [Ardenticatenaceae bacterium]|nr:class I SAM-dependent methyltransferase [Ardenticatenaceae bacterium]